MHPNFKDLQPYPFEKLKDLKRRYRMHSRRLQKYRDEIRYYKMVTNLQNKLKA